MIFASTTRLKRAFLALAAAVWLGVPAVADHVAPAGREREALEHRLRLLVDPVQIFEDDDHRLRDRLDAREGDRLDVVAVAIGAVWALATIGWGVGFLAAAELGKDARGPTMLGSRGASSRLARGNRQAR